MPTDYAAILRRAKEPVAGSESPFPSAPINYAALLRQAKQIAPESQPSSTIPTSSIEQAAQSVTNEMGTGERALVGLGRGLDSAWQGIKQLGLEAGGALGFDTKQALSDQAAQEAENKRIFDAGVGSTGAGMAGAVLGESLPYLAVPLGAAGGAASMAGRALVGVGMGGLAGATQYVDPNESRAANALQGAALGGLTAGALDVAIKGGARLANAVAGRMTPRAEEVAALGKQFNVPVFAPDVAGSPVMNKLSTISEDVPLVGMAKPRLQQSAAAGQAAQSLAGRLAPQIDDVGREIQGSLTRRTEALQKAAGVRYDRVAKAADPLGPVPLTNLRATAKQLLDDAKQDIDPNTALISRLEKIANAPDGPNFSKTRQFRSNIGDSIRQLETSMDLKAARPLQQLKGALEQDMNAFANNAGGEVSARWKSADRFFRERVVPQRESDIVRAMRNKNPDEVFKQFIRSSGQDRAQRLYNALDTKGRDAVKSGILQQALDKATLEGSKGVAFSPAKFAQELERVQGGVGVFFRGADRQEMNGFVKLMRHVERAGQVAENPPTGNRLVLPLLMGETLAPGTSMAALGTGGLSRMLFTTDAGKRLLLASNRFPTGSPGLENIVRRIQQQVAPGAVGAAQAQ